MNKFFTAMRTVCRSVSLMAAFALFVAYALPVSAQQKTVSGTVIDPDGNPLPTYREFVDAVDTLMLFSMFFQLNYGEFDSIIHQYDPFFG